MYEGLSFGYDLPTLYLKYNGYRNELYKECVAALQGGVVLNGKDLETVKKALEEAFQNADMKLLSW